MRRIEREAEALINALTLEGLDRLRAAQLVREFCIKAIGMKRRRTTHEGEHGASDCIKLYIALYQARFGEPPTFDTRVAGGLFGRLAARYGSPLVEARLKIYMQQNDEFVRRCGFSVPLFQQRWNALAVLDADDVHRHAAARATEAQMKALRNIPTSHG